MIPSGYKTAADIRRQIREYEKDQERLREEIGYLREGSPEREAKIDLLFAFHGEIAELAEIAYTV